MSDRRAEPVTLAGAAGVQAFARITASRVGPAEARFCLRYGGETIPLLSGETILGRGGGATVTVDSPGVSRRHARIVVDEHRVTIEDLGSRNGTWVGEERIDRVQEIVESVLIRIGPVWFLLQSVEER
jgi:pSer/pThr/pTyr-binding forkhead associated (FHA) protein